ncbi:MAG: DUF2845 domain-containing protein [Syntrophobacteraceae bacterium]
MRIVLFILVITFSVVYQASGDDSLTDLRCKSGLIMLGESKLEIVSKCGQPASKETVERRVPRSVKPAYVTVEEWTYNFGPSDFIHVMEFEGSTLKAIRRGSRGF